MKNSMRLSAGLLCAACSLPVGVSSALAQCAAPRWLTGPGQTPGLVGVVNASTSWDPDGSGPLPAHLVAAGAITHAGQSPVSNIAVYNPSTNQWGTLGNGLNGEVRLLFVHDNTLYATGVFTASGPTPLSGVAKWTGSSWVSLGFPEDPEGIRALAWYNGQLIVGGMFPSQLMQWNGASWSAIPGRPSGAPPMIVAGTEPGIEALEVYNGELVVGGFFGTVGSPPIPARCIAKWNGTTWSAMGQGLAIPMGTTIGFYARVLALKAVGGKLFVGGRHEGAVPLIGDHSPNMVAWNGVAYESMPGLGGSRFNLVHTITPTPSPSKIGIRGPLPDPPASTSYWTPYVEGPVGPFTGWTLPPPITFASTSWATGSAITLFNGQIVVSGDRLIAGSRLIDLRIGASGNAFDFASAGGSLYVAGVTGGNGVQISGLGRWDGSAWSDIGFNAVGSVPWAGARVLQWHDNALYVGGDFTTVNSINTGGLARYDGSTFSAVGGPIVGTPTIMVSSPQGLIVSGTITSFGGLATPNIARWTGSSWEALGAGLPAVPTAVEVYNGEIYAAGPFIPNLNLLRFNGTSWVVVPGSFDFVPAKLASYGGSLYVAGGFSQSPVGAIGSIVSLTGSTWSEVGGGLGFQSSRAIVRDMLVTNGKLHVLGSIDRAGLATVDQLAIWDGVAWAGVDPGVTIQPNYVNVLGEFNGELLVGGRMNSPTRGLADVWLRLGCPALPACYANCDGSAAAPVLNALDFSCFLNRYTAGDAYANCDGSTAAPTLNALDFACFLNRFVAGCP